MKHLSDHEQQRLGNIRRNGSMIAALGLHGPVVVQRPKAARSVKKRRAGPRLGPQAACKGSVVTIGELEFTGFERSEEPGVNAAGADGSISVEPGHSHSGRSAHGDALVISSATSSDHSARKGEGSDARARRVRCSRFGEPSEALDSGETHDRTNPEGLALKRRKRRRMHGQLAERSDPSAAIDPFAPLPPTKRKQLSPDGRARQCTNCSQNVIRGARGAAMPHPGPEDPASMCKRCYCRWVRQGRPAEWSDTRPPMKCTKLTPEERQCTKCSKYVTRGTRGNAKPGPEGPASMCNSCYHRWAKQGRPPEWSDTRPATKRGYPA